jgi:putative aldouronate transport system permease protein
MKDKRDILFNIINCSIFMLFTFVCVFPLYYIFIITISANDLVNSGRLIKFPQGIHFQNYVNVIKLPGIGQAAIISSLRTVIGTICTLIGSSFLGYLFSKKEMV